MKLINLDGLVANAAKPLFFTHLLAVRNMSKGYYRREGKPYKPERKKKMKKFLLICVAMVIIVAAFAAAYGYGMETERKDERTYKIETTDHSRSDSSKYDIFTQYECGLLVNWNWAKDGWLYEVRTPDGHDGFWSKEAIAEYVCNSKNTDYFGE